MIEKYNKDWKNPLSAADLYNKFWGMGDGQEQASKGAIEDYCTFIGEEFEAVIKEVEIVFSMDDPYTVDGKPNSDFMRAEVARTGRLYIWAGASSGPVPFASNLLFRAVHDYQHITTGGSFSFNGECYTAIPLLRKTNGWVQHILFSEMVAQSAYYAIEGKYLDPQEIVVGCWDKEIEALIGREGVDY